MVARRSQLDTIDDMTLRLPASAASRSTRPLASGGSGDVLGAVASALEAGGERDDWSVLEAWALAITVVTSAALHAVPEELHDFL